MPRKARLLRETVEIAVTEIKRFLEPRLMELMQLRRVSAPLFLPAGSPALHPGKPGARITLESGVEVEIVGALDFWLRMQLREYDIAPGFGVYTVMNALRPDLPWNRTSSPHIAAWSWQQAVDTNACGGAAVRKQARRLYRLLVDTEEMILALFPHLHPTLARDMEQTDENTLAEKFPGFSHERRMYLALRPQSGQEDGCRAIYVERRPSPGEEATSEIWAWNRTASAAVMLADLAARGATDTAPASVGGNLYRDQLAMLILHQDRI